MERITDSIPTAHESVVDETELLEKLLQAQDKGDDRLYYRIGNAYRRKGNLGKAINCYLEAMAINPDSPAKEAHAMLLDILEYYHKEYYNP